MQTLSRAALLLIAGLVLVACEAAEPSVTARPQPAASTAPASSAPDSSPPGASTAPSADAIPSDDLGAYSCEWPLVAGGSVPIANILDVRVGSHDGYDRVVFEFQQGDPVFTLAPAEPPFTEDASGLPLTVDGNAFLSLTMRGGTKQTDEGTSSYDGPTEFTTGFAQLGHLIEGGDFERQSTWYFGLDHEACARVTILDEPHRIVIDVEQ